MSDLEYEDVHELSPKPTKSKRQGTKVTRRKTTSADIGRTTKTTKTTKDKSKTTSSTKPRTIKDVKSLQRFLKQNPNAVVLFKKPNCGFCVMFTPIFKHMTKYVQGTNSKPGSVPIKFAVVEDAEKLDPELEQAYPGMVSEYPTLIFSKQGHIYKWDASKAKELDPILDEMADYFQDETLKKQETNLEDVMNNSNPDFLFLYQPTELRDRFTRPEKEYMTDATEGMQEMARIFLKHPNLMARGRALSIDKLDRPDVRPGTIIDVRNGENKSYYYRHAYKWLKDQVQ